MKSHIAITVEDLMLDEETVLAKVLHFEGELDSSNVDAEAEAINDLVADLADGTYMILDFEKLDYLNSKSIGYLTYWHVKLQHKHAEVVVAAPRDNIQDILNVVGITQIVKMFPTLDEAKLYVQGKASK